MLVKCPVCKGNPLAQTNAFEQLQDWPCMMCLGLGKVDNEIKCVCGRPAIRYAGMLLVCSNDDCVNTALGVQETKDAKENFANQWYEGYYIGE